MLPALIEFLDAICALDIKILVVMPTPFLASATHSKLLRYNSDYTLKFEKIRNLEDLSRITFCSAEKISPEFIGRNHFHKCAIIMDEVDWFADKPVLIHQFTYNKQDCSKFVSLARGVANAKHFVGLTGSLSKSSRTIW